MVTASIAGSVTYDPLMLVFTYSYRVANSASSQQEIDGFSLDVQLPIYNIANPGGWVSSMFNNRSTFGWDAMLISATAPDDGISVPPSIAQIKPGRAVSGFWFQSVNPPGFVTYYVTGFSPIPVQPDEESAENLVEACPQSFGDPLVMAVTGSTVGPTKATPVIVDVEPGKYPNRIDLEEQRSVPIAILGSATFDVTTVNFSSLQAGKGKAAPTDNSPVIQDVNGDGMPDLVAHFSVKALGLGCKDPSLFLTGKKTDGTAFSGADSIVIVDCK